MYRGTMAAFRPKTTSKIIAPIFTSTASSASSLATRKAKSAMFSVPVKP